MSDAVAIDFETFYSSKLGYSIKTLGNERYCKSPLFDAYMVSVSDGTHAWSGSPKDLNWSALEGKLWLSHNRAFDNSVYNELVSRQQVPAVSRIGWECTANMTSYLCNRRALADAVQFLFNVKLNKTVRDSASNKRWPADFSEAERAEMLEYAKADAVWTHKLWTANESKWPQFERDCSNLTIEQGMRGVQINVDLLNQYVMQAHEMKRNTEKLLPWLDDSGDDWEDFEKNKKPTSTKCIAEQCRRSGIPAPPVKSRDGEEEFEEWENTYSPAHAWIPALSSWRSINKLYKMFVLMKERLRPDGTISFGSKYFGAHTGRVSGEDRINMYNMRKLPVVCNERGLMETDEHRIVLAVEHKRVTGKYPEWVRFTIDFRHLIVPRPGKKMIVSDLSQIEPRVLAWLTKDTELLEMLKTGMSLYEAHARLRMGWKGGKLEDENPAMYSLAKANVLALGYGAGWEKYITMQFIYTREDITKDDPEFETQLDPISGEEIQVSGYGQRSRKIVREFRESNSRIVDLWRTLDSAFKQSIGSDFIMTLPSGRSMRYRDVRCNSYIVQDPETKRPRRKNEWTADTGGKRGRKPYYGGKLTENLVQATARDVFMEHALAIERNGWNNLFGVYDEAVLEVDPDVTARDVQQVMSKAPEWMPGIPVTAKAKEVAHYLK